MTSAMYICCIPYVNSDKDAEFMNITQESGQVVGSLCMYSRYCEIIDTRSSEWSNAVYNRAPGRIKEACLGLLGRIVVNIPMIFD